MLCPLQVRLVGMKPQHRNAMRYLSLYAQLGAQIIYCQVLPKSTEALALMLPAGSFELYTLFTIGRVTYRKAASVTLPGLAAVRLDLSAASVANVVDLPHEQVRKQQEGDIGNAQ